MFMDIRNSSNTFERSKTCREALASASLNISWIKYCMKLQAKQQKSYTDSSTIVCAITCTANSITPVEESVWEQLRH